MEQFNIYKIDWSRIVPYIIIFLLSLLLIGSCNGRKELELTNKLLKKEVVDGEHRVSSLLNKNENLLVKLDSLNKIKQKVKVKIVEVENKTHREVEKVIGLNTKQIAKFYQERYKLPITITQYGTTLSDDVAKKNIIEIVQYDGCVSENSLLKDELHIEEQKGVVKDTIISNFGKVVSEYDSISNKQKDIIKNTEKAVRKEKTKKTVWQGVAAAAIIATGFLIVK
jgi:predicted metal-binding protein